MISSAALEKAYDIIVSKCMGLKPEERILIVYDQPLKHIAQGLLDAAKKISKNSFLQETPTSKVNGEEPPSQVADEMKKCPVLILATSKSLSHTKARREASEKGARVASLPGISEDMIARAIDVDYDKMNERTSRLKEILDKGATARITTVAGTDLTVNIKGYNVHNYSGIFTKNGSFGNLPDGEAAMAAQFAGTNGTLIVDASVLKKKVDKNIMIKIEDGKAVDFTGGELASELKEALTSKGEKAFYVAEFAIGTNDKAIITGNTLEDEKVLGTAHIAFGNNVSFDGTNDVDIHLDCVFFRPTISVDGKKIMENGKLM